MSKILFKIAVFLMAYAAFVSTIHAKENNHPAFAVTVTGKGQPMILIPGATCSGDVWKATVAHYSSKYQCHVITLAGYAGTAPLAAAPYLPTMKQQLEQYITDQHLDHVVLAGHSIGGYLALNIAAEMTGHLDKVVIVDAMPFFALQFNPNAPDTFSKAQAEAMLARYNSMDDAALKATQFNTAKFLCRDSTYWDQIATWGAQSDRKTMAYTMTEMLNSDIRKKIADIKVPVLVLAAYCQSAENPMYTRDFVVKAYADQYQYCKACTVHTAENNTKHFVMYDAPEWYFREMDTFVNQ